MFDESPVRVILRFFLMMIIEQFLLLGSYVVKKKLKLSSRSLREIDVKEWLVDT